MQAGVQAMRATTASRPQSSGGRREQQQQLRWIPAFAGMTATAKVNGNGNSVTPET
jgi:hypothetical protein